MTQFTSSVAIYEMTMSDVLRGGLFASFERVREDFLQITFKFGSRNFFFYITRFINSK